MDSTPVLAITAIVIAGLAVLFVMATGIRRDRVRAEKMAHEQAADETKRNQGREVEKAAELARRGSDDVARPDDVVADRPILDDEAVGVTRRQFFNRGIVGMFTVTAGYFGLQSIAFLWPSGSSGFGSKIVAGNLGEILESIRVNKEPFYVPEGRFYINPFPTSDLPKARAVKSYAAVLPGMEKGVVALYQKCVHLGCRVPWCETSQWFECPCHGSQYNRVGEKKAGPAPRGLDRFVVSVEGDRVIVDTGSRVDGPPIGTNTTGQEAEGPHCA